MSNHNHQAQVTAPNATPDRTSITYDPIYYTTVGFFALLTTALPAALGQPRFLPVLQTITLFIFMAITLHRRNPRGALKVMAIWLPIQFVTLLLLTRLLPGQLEAAFTGGFAYRGAITAWFFGGAAYPDAVATQFGTLVFELLGIIIGSLVTAGLAGIWFLARLLNHAAYSAGILLASLEHPGQSLLVFPYWTLLRAAGYAGIITLCAMPLLTYQWSPSTYWRNHHQLILISGALLALGLLLEFFLPGLLARTPVD